METGLSRHVKFIVNNKISYFLKNTKQKQFNSPGEYEVLSRIKKGWNIIKVKINNVEIIRRNQGKKILMLFYKVLQWIQ